MSKLREQFTVNDRLREYIERMLSVIIEHNPQLLEVTMNADSSMGHLSSSIMTLKDTHDTSTTKEVAASETTATTVQTSNDKYCRL
jgi:D-arabinose 5-phosphate isomerase GutQ